eukprot:999305-Prymnesium_polylepis.1
MLLPSCSAVQLLLTTRAPPRCAACAARLDRCDTYVLPRDNQWPHVLLPAWPPYKVAPTPGTLVFVRGSRGEGVSLVAESTDAGEDGLT